MIKSKAAPSYKTYQFLYLQLKMSHERTERTDKISLHDAILQTVFRHILCCVAEEAVMSLPCHMMHLDNLILAKHSRQAVKEGQTKQLISKVIIQLGQLSFQK